jgi:ABC-2 family transporter protein
MTLRRIGAIFRKDLWDAVRDARVLVAILVPLGLGVLYGFMFQNTPTVPTVTVAYTAPAPTALPDQLKAAIGSSAHVTLVRLSSEVDVRQHVAAKQADVGLVIPSGFDAAVTSGATPTLMVVQASTPATGGSIVQATLDGVLRQMAGQHPPATLQIVSMPATQVGFEAVFTQLGLKAYFTLASVMMLVGMITMLAVPIVLGEEREKKTLDALVMIASYREVVVAKALLGMAYIVVAVPLLLALTQVIPTGVVTFVASVALLSVALIGFGLLLGSLFTANQMNTWGGLFLVPILLPPFLVGIPLPGIVEGLFGVLPSTQAMRLLVNSMAPQPLYPQAWLSYLVIIAWGVVAYALVLWRLSQRAE